MTRIAVVYHSVTGTTEALAGAVSSGIESQGEVSVVQLKILGEDIHHGRYVNRELMAQLDQADALVFGTPTFMGSVSAQFKAFMDASSERWAQGAWAGKLAAGFTIGSNYSGDQLNTLQTLQIFAAQHGMLWLGIDIAGGRDGELRNRLGAHSGLIAHSVDGDVHPQDRVTAEYLGDRVAKFARAARRVGLSLVGDGPGL